MTPNEFSNFGLSSTFTIPWVSSSRTRSYHPTCYPTLFWLPHRLNTHSFPLQCWYVPSLRLLSTALSGPCSVCLCRTTDCSFRRYLSSARIFIFLLENCHCGLRKMIRKVALMLDIFIFRFCWFLYARMCCSKKFWILCQFGFRHSFVEEWTSKIKILLSVKICILLNPRSISPCKKY